MAIDSITDIVGNTPVVRVKTFEKYFPAKIYLKLEFFNPTASIKDRPAIQIIRTALSRGDIKPGGTIIESTSGNFGKSLSMLGAALGIKVMVVLDPKASDVTVRFCKALGAQVVMVDECDEHGSYQTARTRKVQELLAEIPGSFHPDQYQNPENPKAHEEYTAREILDDFDHLDAYVACISTGGHFSGVAKVLKKKWPAMSCIAADAVGSSIITGTHQPYLMNGIGLSWMPDNLSGDQIDKYLQIPCVSSFALCRYFARKTGILLGGSSGAALYAALLESRGKSADYVSLTIAPDSGINYLDQFYDDHWLKAKNIEKLPDIEELVAEIHQSNFTLMKDGHPVATGSGR